MAVTTIGTLGGTLTNAQLLTALTNAVGVNLIKINTNGKVFRCVDNLIIQGGCDASGFTFLCDSGKNVKFVGNGTDIVRFGNEVGSTGKFTSPLNIIFSGSTGFGEQEAIVDTHSIFNNCEVIGKRLNISANYEAQNYIGIPIQNSKKTDIKELAITNNNSYGYAYTNINCAKAGSYIKFVELRGTTLKIHAIETLEFDDNASGWAFGESGEDLKLLQAANATINKFSPLFNTSNGTLQLTSTTFSASTRTFKNPNFSKDRVRLYPANNDNSKCIFTKDFIVNIAKQSDGLFPSNIKLYLTSNRVNIGSTGQTNGKVIKYNNVVTQNQIINVRTWEAYNPASGTYTVATKQINDIDINGKLFGYLYNLSYFNVNTEILDYKISNVLSSDNLITEQTKTTVEAYTTLENSYKVYDFAKSYLYDNYAGESSIILTRSGDTLKSSHNIVINPNALNVFSFDGTTITIKASLFAGNINTTGVVTLLNGAVVNGTVSDNNGIAIKIKTNAPKFGLYAKLNGVELNPYEYDLTSKTVTLQAGQVLKCVVSAHGYKPKYIELSLDNLEAFNIVLGIQSAVNTNISEVTKQAIADKIVAESEGQIMAIVISKDMSQYTPEEFMAGFDWFTYKYGGALANAVIAIGTADIFHLSEGTITNKSPMFYVRPPNTIIDNSNGIIYVPIKVIDIGTGVVSIRGNTHNIQIGVALWTKANANLSIKDISDIQNGLAKQTTLDKVKSNTDLIPAIL